MRVRWTSADDRSGIYLGVAGVLLILIGMTFSMSMVSSPPDPVTFSALTAAGVGVGLAITSGGIATVFRIRFGLAFASAIAVLAVNVAYGLSSGSFAQAVGGVVTALAILVLVVAGRKAFRDQRL